MKSGGLRHPKSSKIGVVRHPGAILGALGPSKASQVTFFLLFASLLGYHFGAFSVLFHIKILRVFFGRTFCVHFSEKTPPRDPGGTILEVILEPYGDPGADVKSCKKH